MPSLTESADEAYPRRLSGVWSSAKLHVCCRASRRLNGQLHGTAASLDPLLGPSSRLARQVEHGTGIRHGLGEASTPPTEACSHLVLEQMACAAEVSQPMMRSCGIIRSFSCPAVLDRPQPPDARMRRSMKRRGFDPDQQASGPVSATRGVCPRLPGCASSVDPSR